MAKILKFPVNKAAKERFRRIETLDEIEALNAECREIEAKVDAEIEKYGGLEGYGKMIMREKLGPFYRDVWPD